MTAIVREFYATTVTSTDRFNYSRVNDAIASLREKSADFIRDSAVDEKSTTIDYSAEARYPRQIWELEVRLPTVPINSADDVSRLEAAFHKIHREIFAIEDAESPIEIMGIRARVTSIISEPRVGKTKFSDGKYDVHLQPRIVNFRGYGAVESAVHAFDAIAPDVQHEGPAIIESPVTTIVVDPGATFERRATGSLVITPMQVAGQEPLQRIPELTVE